MKIAIIGAGAVGSIFASLLIKSGQDVTLIGKDPGKVSLLNEKGIKVEGVSGSFTTPVKAVIDANDADHGDLLLVCVKAYDTRRAIEEHKSIIGPDTMVLTVQNGLGNVEQINHVCAKEKILAGTTAQGGYLINTGHLHHAGMGMTHIGQAFGKNGKGSRSIADLFNNAGIKTEISENVDALIWAKLVVSVGINALTALLKINNGKTTTLKWAREIQKEAVAEALAVAKKEGIDFDYDEVARRVVNVANVTSENVSSMLTDRLNHRRTEIDYINGAICNLGKKHGVQTPVNSTLTSLIRATEEVYGKTV